jgi:hypothetical protein
MPSPTRSVAIALAENAEAITEWRNALPERQRRRLVGPQNTVRRWRTATGANGKSPADFKRDAAEAAWRKFVACIEALAPDQQRQLWHEVQARADLGLSPCRAADPGTDLPAHPI